MTPEQLIEAVRTLLVGAGPGEDPVRADVEATLLELAGPAMSVGQLNRLLTLRLESERFSELLAEPGLWDEGEREAARTRALAAVDELAAVFGLSAREAEPEA